MKLLVTLVGLVLVLEAIPYVAAPHAMQRWLRQLAEEDPEKLRIMGLVAMALGLFIVYMAKRGGVL